MMKFIKKNSDYDHCSSLPHLNTEKLLRLIKWLKQLYKNIIYSDFFMFISYSSL